ncbi:MAG: MGMT family protein [Acidimicrobiales bacterium]|nr:MGMT family protein [Acidimicrobiales bacterium]
MSWNSGGVISMVLPTPGANSLEQVVMEKSSRVGCSEFAKAQSPKDAIAKRTISLVNSYFDGKSVDFSPIDLNWYGLSDFSRAVLGTLRNLPSRETITYGDLASFAGYPGASRATGTALSNNPFPVIVPCHRVIKSNGGLGEFSAGGGAKTKLRLLKLEGSI